MKNYFEKGYNKRLRHLLVGLIKGLSSQNRVAKDQWTYEQKRFAPLYAEWEKIYKQWLDVVPRNWDTYPKFESILYTQLQDDRVYLKGKSRHILLAYGFLKGKAYKTIESKHNAESPPSAKMIFDIISFCCGDAASHLLKEFSIEQIKTWLKGEESMS